MHVAPCGLGSLKVKPFGYDSGLHEPFSFWFFGLYLWSWGGSVLVYPVIDFLEDFRVFLGDVFGFSDIFSEVVEFPGSVAFLLNCFEFSHSDGLH